MLSHPRNFRLLKYWNLYSTQKVLKKWQWAWRHCIVILSVGSTFSVHAVNEYLKFTGKYKDIQESTNITQKLGNPQNSWRQKGDKKQELYRGPTDNHAPLHTIRSPERPGDLATWRPGDLATWRPGTQDFCTQYIWQIIL
jgi:hypothetical protein